MSRVGVGEAEGSAEQCQGEEKVVHRGRRVESKGAKGRLALGWVQVRSLVGVEGEDEEATAWSNTSWGSDKGERGAETEGSERADRKSVV